MGCKGFHELVIKKSSLDAETYPWPVKFAYVPKSE